MRIYLGAAPGVGKTFAMLGEAHRRRERGTDVVVGLVETHGREKTAELLTGLDVLPRAQVVHRGLALEEMDVDGLLARRPEVAVVDELAHTNAPGSRNAKRWEDVEELLEAGVDVLSTVNVQHLESLNDVVQRITGVPQRETVPDEVVRRAEQIELVDLTPEALRRRLAHGNVYPASKIDAALGNYFRLGNLTALREIALLWVADQVDVALRRYRAEQSITDTWEARERVDVAITGGGESETLIRRARRIATRAGAELQVLHILRGDGLAGAPPAAVAGYRTLAADVGATFHTVVGDDVPTALLEFARGTNATQLVIGTSRRSRLARLFSEGIGATVLQESGPIDVHMVTHAQSGTGWRAALSRSPLRPSRRVLGWLLAVLAPVAATAVGVVLREDLIQSTNVVDYFLATVLVALVGGLGPAVFAAIFSALLLNFYFTPPLFTFTVDTQQNVVTLIAMVVVGVTVALVVDRAARRATQAAAARTEATLLASYARTVLTNPYPLVRLLEKVRENFGLASVVLLERADGDWARVESAGIVSTDEPDVDIPVTPDVRLVLRGRLLPASDRRVLEAAAGQALLALRQQRMADQARDAQRRAEGTELRTALLSAVGHDLRTPLTSIKAAIGSLRDAELALSTEDVGELHETIEVSADRLTALIDNLLDSSRLATGAVRPRFRPVGLDEVVARALSGVDDTSRVEVDVDEQLTPVNADVGLLERVVANVVDNALRYGGASVAIRASVHANTAELRIVDHGPGLPRGAAEEVFAPFQRLGDRDATPGVGLGLSVAKGFTEAMNGTIRAEDTPGGGLTVVIALPVSNEEHNT